MAFPIRFHFRRVLLCAWLGIVAAVVAGCQSAGELSGFAPQPPVATKPAAEMVQTPQAAPSAVAISQAASGNDAVRVKSEPVKVATRAKSAAGARQAGAGQPQPQPLPNRVAERHITAFYSETVRIYDKPYGAVIGELKDKSFPREAMSGDRAGVPVYSTNASFVEVPLPQGGTGWIGIQSVNMTSAPCKVAPNSTHYASGPIGAGSTSVDCVRN